VRILWVKAGKLLPVDSGGRIRSYHILRQLAARHEIVLLSYYGGPIDPAYESAVTAEFPGAEVVRTGGPGDSWVGSAVDYAGRLIRPAPYAVTKFTSSPVRRAIARRSPAVDAAVCDFLSASLNFPRRLTTPTILFQHNVESRLWQRQAEHEPNRLKRLLFRIEATKMARYERTAVGRFHRIVAVSAADRDEMAGMVDPSRLTIVPTGVDVTRFLEASAHPRPDSRPLVLFVGSMDWEANVDAVAYFCREMWPAVRAAVPQAILRIVGRNPHARVARLQSPSIEVTGAVPSVVEHLAAATAVIVPLRIGGGTRLKIFEAMAAGRAVVSTRIGAEGLDVADGRDVVLADSPREFAAATVRLLTDAGYRQRLERAAADLAARHDWSIVARSFEAAIEHAVAGFRPASGGRRVVVGVEA
jgi:glycosyltransferase involved in cell wall biosynthesis